MKIGIIDLDTSHPEAWLPLERELGCEITGLWDGGSVHPQSYVRQFAATHGISRVFDSPEAMLPHVDGVIIHGCDWDTHVEKARPFVLAGKAVLIDKPVAGNLDDLRQFASWVREGAKITGGSALRYTRELAAWRALPPGQRGTPHTVLCGCATDDFNYGIHAYTLLCAVMGGGACSVRHLGDGVQQRIQINWPDGRIGWLAVGELAGGWMPTYATIVTERKAVHIQPEPGNLYRSFLERVLPWFTGRADEPPCAFDTLIEPELIALAALQSRQCGGREVTLAQISPDTRYCGASFARAYRQARYG